MSGFNEVSQRHLCKSAVRAVLFGFGLAASSCVFAADLQPGVEIRPGAGAITLPGAGPGPLPVPAQDPVVGMEENRPFLPDSIVEPRYPEAALAARQEGWVKLQFTVDETGAVVDPKVVTSCVGAAVDSCAEGGDTFNESALQAIREFKFLPRLEDGAKVSTPAVQYVINFILPENRKQSGVE